MDHAQTMQQRDQARAAFVGDLEFLLDIGADFARRTRQRLSDPGFQLVLLFDAQTAGTAFVAKSGKPFDPVFFIQTKPGADCIVVNEECRCDTLAAPAFIQKNKGIRPPREPMLNRPVPSELDQVASCLASRNPARIDPPI